MLRVKRLNCISFGAHFHAPSHYPTTYVDYYTQAKLHGDKNFLMFDNRHSSMAVATANFPESILQKSKCRTW